MGFNVGVDHKKLKKVREKTGLSQSKVAHLLGITRQAVWRLEAGKVGLNGDFLARLCLLYGVQITDLVSEMEPRQPAA